MNSHDANPQGSESQGTNSQGMGSQSMHDVFATFAKEGGRVGSGALGSGQGGVTRCAK